MAIVLVKPQKVHVCIRCGLPISFEYLKLPIVKSRRNPTPIAYFYAHPDADACAREAERRNNADSHDIGNQRARLLDIRLAEIQAEIRTDPDGDDGDLGRKPGPEIGISRKKAGRKPGPKIRISREKAG